jgi:hypothetical protein
VTDSEIMKMCKRLAGKFRSQTMYEDLVSEGILACYEAKAKGKDLVVLRSSHEIVTRSLMA